MPGEAELLRSLAESRPSPDGSPYEAVTCKALRELAQRLGREPRTMETAALEAGLVPERYARNMRQLSAEDQIRLLASRVAMVGLGGLGGSVLETLVRLGVGAITAADGDEFEESNLNRQVLCCEENLGQSKAQAALGRAAAVNASVSVLALASFLDRNGMDALFKGAHVAVDALGGLRDRMALHEAAREAGLPLVTAAVAGWSGYVATVYPGDPNPATFFTLAQDSAAGKPGGGAEDILGCLAPVVATAAALQCAEVARVLLHRDMPADSPERRGRVLVFDLARQWFESVRL